jgi:membrane-bound metal-dependent hydrolase YbcI (DUF457 family)
MPSPLGHALAGALFGGAVAGRHPPRALAHPWWRAAAFFALLGCAADLDFLFGEHSGRTHSIGATLIVGLSILVATRGRRRWAIAGAAAYGSHILLDMLGHDTTPPIGVMALWPFSRGYYEANLHVFMAISRRYWLPGFVTHNLIAVVWELVLLGLPAALVWRWRRARALADSGRTP